MNDHLVELLQSSGEGEWLAEQEKQFLDSQGYLSLGQLLSESEVEAMTVRLGEILEAEGDRGGL